MPALREPAAALLPELERASLFMATLPLQKSNSGSGRWAARTSKETLCEVNCRYNVDSFPFLPCASGVGSGVCNFQDAQTQPWMGKFRWLLALLDPYTTKGVVLNRLINCGSGNLYIGTNGNHRFGEFL